MQLKGLLFLAIGLSITLNAKAVLENGWEQSDMKMWRMTPSHDNVFFKNSPSKLENLDSTILHNFAFIKQIKSLTQSYTFKIGCVYQSKTPALEIALSNLAYPLVIHEHGFGFARLMIDNGQEYSLRGEIKTPSRVIFTPHTRLQERKLADIYLQLAEGGNLKLALLQGSNRLPRVFEIPLKGFTAYSQRILSDCQKLNSMVQDYKGAVSFLPDYIDEEPLNMAPIDYTLKPKKGNDGLTPKVDDIQAKLEEKKEEELPPKILEEETPSLQLFTPGGSAASIGDDGKPITLDANSNDNNENSLGESKGIMQIGEDGTPISN